MHRGYISLRALCISNQFFCRVFAKKIVRTSTFLLSPPPEQKEPIFLRSKQQKKNSFFLPLFSPFFSFSLSLSLSLLPCFMDHGCAGPIVFGGVYGGMPGVNKRTRRSGSCDSHRRKLKMRCGAHRGSVDATTETTLQHHMHISTASDSPVLYFPSSPKSEALRPRSTYTSHQRCGPPAMPGGFASLLQKAAGSPAPRPPPVITEEILCEVQAPDADACDRLRDHALQLLCEDAKSVAGKNLKAHVKAGSITLPGKRSRQGPGAVGAWEPPALPMCLVHLVSPAFQQKTPLLQECPLCAGRSPIYRRVGDDDSSASTSPKSSVSRCGSISTDEGSPDTC